MLQNRIISLSNQVVRIERKIVATLAMAITLFALLNVTTRTLNKALFWVDELAVYTMIWMVLIGSSIMVRERSGIAAVLFVDLFGEFPKKIFGHVVDIIILFFSVILFVLCWQWYDLPGLVHFDFNFENFSAYSFNFIYEEPTNTLGIKKYLIWLVVPLVAMSLILHSSANIIESVLKKPRDTFG